MTNLAHAALEPVPAEALLAEDFELHLVHAPLMDTSIPCANDACDISDGPCTCDE